MEACTGDPARRLGMEFVFQMLGQQNVETLNDAGVKKIVATCPHCFNTLANEYPQIGGNYEVVHHTQLLAHLVEEGKLTPVAPIEENITYHDPCFLGRHNKVYKQPRDIMATVPGVKTQEMHRHKDRGFCCGDAAPGCGWKSASASASTPSASTRPWRPTRHRLHRLPVLPGHAGRRHQREEERGRGQGVPGSRGRLPAPDPLHQGRGLPEQKEPVAAE